MMSSSQRLISFVLCWRQMLVCGFLLPVLLACGQPAVPAGEPLVQGRAFPKSVLDFISGSNDANGALQGKMLVLNVWATWCLPCRSEMPGLDRLSKSLDPNRFAVLGLSMDTDTLLAAEFLVQHGITFTNFLDQNGKMAHSLGLKVYPETFVIAPDRTLVKRMTGVREWDSPAMVDTLEGLYQLQQRAGVAPGADHQ